jgi:hypothetical protein
MEASAIGGDEGRGRHGMVRYGKGEDRRGGRAEMGKIGFTWDRRGERVCGVMPFSRIGEDLADGAVRAVAWRAWFCGGHRDAEDGGRAVHAGVGRRGGRGDSRTEGRAGGDMLEGGRDGVGAEDVEGVAGWFRGGRHVLRTGRRVRGRAGGRWRRGRVVAMKVEWLSRRGEWWGLRMGWVGA